MISWSKAFFVLFFAIFLSQAVWAGDSVDPDLAKLVEADWQRQEEGRGRTIDSPAAIRSLFERAGRLLENLGSKVALGKKQAELDVLARQLDQLDKLDSQARADLYRDTRWLVRSAALSNPLVTGQPIAFMKRRRFVCQMLHEYLSYFYQYSNTEGGEVCVLKRPGKDLSIDRLTAKALPGGVWATLALSYDAKKLYFTYAKLSEKADRPEKQLLWPELSKKGPALDAHKHLAKDESRLHLYSINVDGSELEQLTDGPYDDFDPCPMPGGELAFMSTRRGGFGRCHGDWEPLPVYCLHSLNLDDDTIRTLSFHETNEWHPSVLADGRIVYSRWDYVDRSAAHFHGLWVSNPDGTNLSSLFGNYTQEINACYQPKSVPGSEKILMVAGAHHSVVGGALVLLDPSLVRMERETTEDSLDCIERLTPEVVFPEAHDRWPKTYYHSPWPLSEDYYLTTYSHEPLAGMGPNVPEDGRTGLYYFDRFGNLELLYEDPEISCQYPLPLVRRDVPRSIPSQVDPVLAQKNEGLLVLADVRKSLVPLDEDRKIDHLRIFQVLPKGPDFSANKPHIGYARAENARMLLGTVPVESDGSAYFRVPAKKPIFFQAVDQQGKAVQTMRSEVYLQPGERRSCVGCHEPTGHTPPYPSNLIATSRAPSKLAAGPDGSKPMSFVRLIQPVLDRHCTACHSGDGSDKANQLDLTGKTESWSSKAYQSLRPFLRWYEWGSATYRPISTLPGQVGADISPLTKIVEDKNHAEVFSKIPDEDRRRLWLWMDANGPFYGTFDRDEMKKQQKGEAIAEPLLQ
jgi:Hydrazine synthase alpha subunit middle domain